jgi:hypothetical protein
MQPILPATAKHQLTPCANSSGTVQGPDSTDRVEPGQVGADLGDRRRVGGARPRGDQVRLRAGLGWEARVEPGGLLMAGSVLAIAPIVIMFLLVQRSFVQGIATTVCRAKLSAKAAELLFPGDDQAARRYSLMAPPRTRCRRTGALIGTTVPGSWSGGRLSRL